MKKTPQPSAVTWLDHLAQGEISSVELVEQVLARIQAANPALNAAVEIDTEQSLFQAKQADQERAQGTDKPLLGLPITVKDSIDVKGFKCTGGSFARENYAPSEDASAIARLRAAGAIIVAKTNLPEYSSSYETDNAIFGRANNPIDLARTPGGSTGGEGALLGADASIVGIGVDGGGSIRLPSHYCGIVGIRPTVGRVPDTGHWPHTHDTGYRDLMCIGPMARYVEDLALLLPIMSGPDWIDPFALPFPLGNPKDLDVSAMRIGYYSEDGTAKVSPETRAAVVAAAAALKDCGAEVVEVEAPKIFKDATSVFFQMAGADGGSRTWRDLEGSEGRHHKQFQDLLDGFGESLSLADFCDLQGKFFEFRSQVRRFLTGYDAIICPVTGGPAPLHGETPWGVPADEYFKYESFNNLHIYAVGGAPSTSIRAGEQDGMPLGVQVVAQPYQEHVSFAVAAKLEAAFGGFQPKFEY